MPGVRRLHAHLVVLPLLLPEISLCTCTPRGATPLLLSRNAVSALLLSEAGQGRREGAAAAHCNVKEEWVIVAAAAN